MSKQSNLKLKHVPRTVNEIIADRAIRHALYLERYKTGQVLEIIKILNASTEPKLIAQIEKGLRDITATSPRLQRLFKDNGELVKAEYAAMQIRLQKNLKELSVAEGSWQLKALVESVPVALDFLGVSPQVLRALVDRQAVEGVLLKDWFAELSHKTAFRVNQQIQIGMINGEGIEPIVRRIMGTRAAQYSDGILNISRREARAVVRTAVGNVSIAAREELYKENEDVIKGEKIIGTLDTDTCLICAEEDGKVYPVGVGKRPKYHFNCRCDVAPVLRSWKELGIDLQEAPEGTRASMNGQVPATVKYADWIQDQPADIQDEALGPRRAALLRAGNLNVGDFVNREDRVLTLRELEKKAG